MGLPQDAAKLPLDLENDQHTPKWIPPGVGGKLNNMFAPIFPGGVQPRSLSSYCASPTRPWAVPGSPTPKPVSTAKRNWVLKDVTQAPTSAASAAGAVEVPGQ